MDKSVRWKLILIIIVIGFCVWMALPLKEKIHLGLDLKGGMHLVLQVMTDEAIEMQTDIKIAQLKEKFKEASIEYEKITKPKRETDKEGKVDWVENKIIVSGVSYTEKTKIDDILEEFFTDEWDVNFVRNTVTMTLKPIIEMNMKHDSVNQAMEKISNRIDEFGVANTSIQRQGLSSDSNRILVQLPGVDDEERVKDLLLSTALLEWKHVEKGPYASEEDALNEYNGSLPDDLEILSHRKGRKKFYVVRRAPIVTGNHIKRARRSHDGYGRPAVGFSFKGAGANLFRIYTTKNKGQYLSIVLDGKIESVAIIEAIISYEGILSGDFTADEVNDLVLMLNSGALPAKLEIMYEKIVGPSLGADSIKKGVTAAIIGLILVIGFMLFFYKGAGINSVIALILNLVILMGVLAYFKATLTLPGIAGVILTIGMAVDANVLVFERIKEDLKAGKTPKAAIDSGFKKAFVTIFDANLTTAIAAIFLFQFGTGPIKGFSVTLIIGITASMFTAVFVSRAIFDLVYSTRKKLKKISI